MNNIFANIKEVQAILLKNTDTKIKRFLFDKIDFNQRLIGVIGARGVGKTTLILQYLRENHYRNESALFLYADNYLFTSGDLFNLARDFYLKENGRLMCVDEIHRFPNWNQELKNIYDSFPEMKIIFSGSSSLNLTKGKNDLSRRGVMYHLPGLSFREYLLFKGVNNILPYSFNELRNDYKKIARDVFEIDGVYKHFADYSNAGYYPFCFETNNKNLYRQQINSIIDKIIYEDIAGYYKLKTESLIVFKQVLNFFATISPGEININKLAQTLDKNHETITNFLEMLNETELIRFLSSDKSGYGLIRKAKKMYLDNTDLAMALNFNLGKDFNIGTRRELFVLNQLQNAGMRVVYSSMGDFVVDGVVLEIGGRSKKFKQIAGVKNSFLVKDDVVVADDGVIPLILFGFLY